MKKSMNLFIIQQIKRILFGGTVCCLLSGYLSTKDITYFNYYRPVNPEMDELVTNMKVAFIPMVKPDDILSITVSSLDKDDREIFNPLPTLLTQQSQIGGFIVLQGFKVDTLGNIHFPQIGEMKVAGLTAKEVEVKMTEQLEPYIKSPTVYVCIANYIVFFIPKAILLESLHSSLQVALIKNTSIINLSIHTPVPKRGEDMLSQLIIAYNRAAVSDKNNMAGITLNFIEECLKLVEKNLQNAEQNVEQYKMEKGITDISAESSLFLQNIQIKLKIYD